MVSSFFITNSMHCHCRQFGNTNLCLVCVNYVGTVPFFILIIIGYFLFESFSWKVLIRLISRMRWCVQSDMRGDMEQRADTVDVTWTQHLDNIVKGNRGRKKQQTNRVPKNYTQKNVSDELALNYRLISIIMHVNSISNELQLSEGRKHL